MKFDLIIGNPPYQEKTGGGTVTEDAIPLYNMFIDNAMQIKPKYISMIIPSRWMSGGKPALDNMRRNIITDRHICKIYNYAISTDIFEDVDIAGGIQYFLIDTSKQYDKIEFHNIRVVNGQIQDNIAIRGIDTYRYTDAHGNNQYMIISDNRAASIIAKIMEECNRLGINTLDNRVLPRMPFGFESNYEGLNTPIGDYNIKVICSNNRETYTNKESVLANQNIINKYKVCVGKLTCEHGGTSSGAMNVLTKPFILYPGEVCSNSYLVINTHDNIEDATNALQYLKTKLVRFLIKVTLSGMNITARNFMFTPDETINNGLLLDRHLYEKYRLSDDEIRYIENSIKVMQ